MIERTTKEKIMDTSIELFAKQGYAQTSIRQIAETVGIQSSSIYNHFASKEDIMEQILAEYKEIVFMNKFPGREVWNQKEKFTAKEICEIFFYKFELEDYEKYINIIKFVYTEHTHFKELQDFLLKKTIFDVFKDFKNELDFLVESKKIDDCDTVSLSSAIVAISLAYTILSTMDENFTHPSYKEKTNMFASLEYVIKLAIEKD